MIKTKGRAARFAVCIRNTGYPASLDVRKIYRVLPDRDAEGHGMLRTTCTR
jgi:hypothetical protein